MSYQFCPALVRAELSAPWEGTCKEMFEGLYECEVNLSAHCEYKVTLAPGSGAPSSGNDWQGFGDRFCHIRHYLSDYDVRLAFPDAFFI